jgi:hypothetical protein
MQKRIKYFTVRRPVVYSLFANDLGESASCSALSTALHCGRLATIASITLR